MVAVAAARVLAQAPVQQLRAVDQVVAQAVVPVAAVRVAQVVAEAVPAVQVAAVGRVVQVEVVRVAAEAGLLLHADHITSLT